ncbi:flagellar brake protein [Paenibacillus bovis]|uniref:PilZ domain-containing protein n=1 Tax=Paenibacillus bovis TaxID=1616788 RepID=A0A172ZIV6_9BACL|nr:PilZ domain-containing protein [Paenibacillus bovis]ANF97469.1 hypothetical protein AR543_16620 [Paenibacillus bovis]
MEWKQGSTLYIQIHTAGESRDTPAYPCMLKAADDSFLYVDVLHDPQTGEQYMLQPEEQLQVLFDSEDGTRYRFDSRSAGYNEMLRLTPIVKPIDQQIVQTEASEYLRVRSEIEVAIRKGEQRSTVITTYISAGGMTVTNVRDIELTIGDQLECWLLIHMKNGSIEHIPLEAALIGEQSGEGGEKQYSMQYSEISDSDRQKLIRYCFERQFDFRSL